MARCACAEAVCQCVFQDSATIAVPGAGSPGSPYEPELIPTGAAPVLISVDAGNDLVLGADGLLFVDTGSATVAVRSTAVGTTFLPTDYLILANAAGGGFTVNLPTAVGITGRIYVLKKTDATVNGVTLDAAGAETIDGLPTFALALPTLSVTVVSDGVGWRVI